MSEIRAQEPYHLPDQYEENRITLMARDPNWLYVYWEVPDERKNAFIQDFGQALWDRSVPAIKVTHVSKNESFFVRINEFSNSWYIHVPNANSVYLVEIGRKVSERFFIPLGSSNPTVTPGDNVSTNTTAYFVHYSDLKLGKFDFDSLKVIQTHASRQTTGFISGTSSPEFIGLTREEAFTGESSARLLPFHVSEHLGISSDELIR